MTKPILPKVNYRKIWLFGMHSLVIASIAAFQIALVVYSHATISFKGILTIGLQIALYILNVLWITPKTSDAKAFAIALAKLVLAIFCFMVLWDMIILFAGRMDFSTKQFFSKGQLLLTVFQLLLILPVSSVSGFYRQSEKNRIKAEAALKAYVEATAEKKRVETTMYQMQLNPHLAFNTLTAIKVQTESDLPNVALAAGLLSGILRHSLIDLATTWKINLLTDIAILKDQISLHRYLSNGKVYVELEESYDGMVEDLEVPPGLLFTLLDNMFKYGMIYDKDYPARINITINDGTLSFRTWNYKRLRTSPGAGVGLKNVRAILEYFYPDRHDLSIEQTEETFELTLLIEL